jgi:hypothetical protein
LKTEEIVSLFSEADPQRIEIIKSLAAMLANIPDQLPPTANPAMVEQMKPLQALKAMTDAEPPTVEDLPESLVTRFVGRHGKHLMRLYTSANLGTWTKWKNSLRRCATSIR